MRFINRKIIVFKCMRFAYRLKYMIRIYFVYFSMSACILSLSYYIIIFGPTQQCIFKICVAINSRHFLLVLRTWYIIIKNLLQILCVHNFRRKVVNIFWLKSNIMNKTKNYIHCIFYYNCSVVSNFIAHNIIVIQSRCVFLRRRSLDSNVEQMCV